MNLRRVRDCLVSYYPFEFWNLLIFVLSPLLIRSDIGELGLSTETLKHIQRTWVISLLQILFTRFSAVRRLIIYQPSPFLKILSYLMSIVGIISSPKHTLFNPSRDAPPTRIFSIDKL